MPIERVGIVANIAKTNVGIHARALRTWLNERGVAVLFHRALAQLLNEAPGYETDELARRVDLLAVMGGDGTILSTARGAKEIPVPILGINVGQFGYLADVNLDEMYEVFSAILGSRLQTEQRMMLDVDTLPPRKDATEKWTVLNDVVINRGNLSRIVEIETFVDGAYLTTFKADGLIVSTPTGSTAYSLSAGGPIVFPQQDAIIMNPICPHTLTNRPIILPASAHLTVTLWSKEEGATLTLDGQVPIHLHSGETTAIARSPFSTILVISPHRNYLEILRSKLGWGGMPMALMER